MLKILFLTHRYLGILLGLVMVLWCLSGFIMMYKSYPELSEQQKQALLPPLKLESCCMLPTANNLEQWQFDEFQLQMLGSFPVLHLRTNDGRLVTIDLEHDRIFHSIPDSFAQHLSDGFAASQQYPAARLMGVIENDQWTVYGAYNPHRPLYQFSANDEIGSQWYLSSRTGEVIQLTTRSERVWGFLGAVIHWLYPTILREKVRLWSQVVIWLTIAGIFLTATGLYFGIRQYRKRHNGRKSPYRGLSRWHHITGLVFGFFTFSWVLSGLFSMQPGGLLESEGAQVQSELLRGGSIQWQQIAGILPRMNEIDFPPETVRIEGKMLNGELALYSVDNNGVLQRYDGESLLQNSFERQRFESLAEILSPVGESLALELIREEDAYYYNHHETVTLPAYRVLANDGRGTRYYLNPVNGEIMSKVDSAGKLYRWLHYGLHRGDFSRFIRSRPVWDILMGILMAGVTFGAITGMFIGCRRLVRRI
ncbi:MAG: hypothetical protein ACI934_002311 [Pseudohongiellaceae bacterium]|jgi:hypothetical protein